MYSGIGRSLGTDYFLIADQLTREELGYLRRTRDFVDNEATTASTSSGSPSGGSSRSSSRIRHRTGCGG
jgi:hypothetical protein